MREDANPRRLRRRLTDLVARKRRACRRADAAASAAPHRCRVPASRRSSSRLLALTGVAGARRARVRRRTRPGDPSLPPRRPSRRRWTTRTGRERTGARERRRASTELRARVRASRLADERAWRRLLHYHDDLRAGSGPSASVHVDDRALLPCRSRGSTRRRPPSSTRRSTRLFDGAASAPTGADDDPRCRASVGPASAGCGHASATSIESGGTLEAAAVSAPCAAYTAWRETGCVRTRSTLVFPAAYLNNPVLDVRAHAAAGFDPPGHRRRAPTGFPGR